MVLPAYAPLLGLPQTLNDRLRDRALRHHIRLQSYGAGLADEAVQLLRQAEPELVGKLVARLLRAERRGYDRGPVTTQRLRDILVGIGEMVDQRYARVAGHIEGRLVALASGEAREQLAQLADELPVRLEMELPPAELLRSIVVDRPFEGRTTRGWWTKVADTEKSGYARAVQQGLVQGETVPQIVGRITGRKGVTQLAERQATAVVRTAVNHTSGHARDATYRANADLLRGVQIVATLDSRTTPICWSMDGKVFPVGEGPRPPFHYNCRTTTVPLVKGFEELDVDAQRVPAASRASWRGQVPARLSYPEWFLGQPEWFQEKVLGPRRFALFRAGLEDLRQFVDTQGRLYTLDELYVRYPEAAAAAAHVPAASVLPVATAVARRALQERLDAIELPTAAPATPAEVAEFRATMDRVGRLVQAAGTAAAAAGLSTSETADAIRALQQRVMPFIRALRAFLAGLPINTLRLFAREAGIAVWRTATRESLLAILTELDKARAMTIERAVARLT